MMVQSVVVGVLCVEVQTGDSSSAQSHGPSDVIEHLFLTEGPGWLLDLTVWWVMAGICL